MKRGWWDALPSIVPGRGNTFTPSYSARKGKEHGKVAEATASGSSSAWSSSSAYSAGTGARLIAEMVPARLSSATKGSVWGSRENLASKMLGVEEEGDVLPIAEDREDEKLGRYFGNGGVGIKLNV